MNINLKYFGMIAETIGKIEEEMFVDVEQITPLEFTNILQKKYPQLQTMSFKIAINQTIVAEDSIIYEGDEIALLPPFSGG